MRQRELMEFRTPQHPSFGSNNWGGASPLLARNIPKEALEQRYLRLNTSRGHEQVFPPATIEEVIFKSQPSKTIKDEIFAFLKVSEEKYCYGNGATHRRSRGRLWRWRPRKQRACATLGNSSSKWLPKWDSKNRWPNGWC
ncbi:hypothetical protein AAHA92_18144 [Salvia divinorum]|uniref:Uncharacterized protein n=1 Tax=Salvia divinorum TaxID=28513 RepID=A0ABD1H405_SALDI